MSKPTVFISGATGFIAQHIIKQLLDSKTYKVVGSVRSAAKAEKLESDFGNHPDLSLVTVEDLSKLDAFDSVFKEHGASFDYIFHTASPVSTELRSIFEATVKYAPNVKKFVQTSSSAALRNPEASTDPSVNVTEKSWNTLGLEESTKDYIKAYFYSKGTAEKISWELHEKLGAKFELTVINPVYVFGPQAFDSSVSNHLNFSCEVINSIVHSKFNTPLSNSVKGNFIDVRDVARAHVEALTSDKLSGQRLILSENIFSSELIANIINEKFPQLNGKIAKPSPISNEEISKHLANIDNHVTKGLLSFEFRDLTTIVVDTVSQILNVEAKK
ncbi:hypothetical protein ACO0RG_000116 [Hanseniaspora osmophila]